jgi:hypothetical protein
MLVPVFNELLTQHLAIDILVILATTHPQFNPTMLLNKIQAIASFANQLNYIVQLKKKSTELYDKKVQNYKISRLGEIKSE